jgi:hypothetical protein
LSNAPLVRPRPEAGMLPPPVLDRLVAATDTVHAWAGDSWLVTTICDAAPVAGNVADDERYVPSLLSVSGGNTKGLVDVYGVVIVIVPGLTVTSMFCVSTQLEPGRLQAAGAATVTTTADDVDDAYEMLVGVNSAVMLSLPWGKAVVDSVAVPVVPLTVVVTGEPRALDPTSNWTEPATPAEPLSLSVTVAVKVSEAPKAMLFEPAASAVAVGIGELIVYDAVPVELL